MDEMIFYDCNCRIGNPFNRANIVFAPDAETLTDELTRSGVAKALVRHAATGPEGAEATNSFLAGLLEKDDSGRLTGLWSVNVDSTDEQLHGEAFFKAMKRSRISALTLAPTGHRFVPARIAIGKKMDAARERKVPIIVDPAHFGGWGELYRFLEEFPDNTYICCAMSLWGADKYFRPLLETYSRFHVDCGAYWVPEGVADLVKKYGAERILYGSGYPDYDHGSMMLAIRHSPISSEEKALVSGGNLERLLSEVEL